MTNETEQALEALDELSASHIDLDKKYSMFTHDRYHKIRQALTAQAEKDRVMGFMLDCFNLIRHSPKNEDGSPWINGGMSNIGEICDKALEEHAKFKEGK